jgi:hypothetical protein
LILNYVTRNFCYFLRFTAFNFHWTIRSLVNVRTIHFSHLRIPSFICRICIVCYVYCNNTIVLGCSEVMAVARWAECRGEEDVCTVLPVSWAYIFWSWWSRHIRGLITTPTISNIRPEQRSCWQVFYKLRRSVCPEASLNLSHLKISRSRQVLNCRFGKFLPDHTVSLSIQ